LVADLQGSAQVFRSANEEVTGYLGASARWSGHRYNRTFFGISEGESELSDLPVYIPGSSFRDVGVSGIVRWVLSDHWSLNGSMEYSRLLSDVARSPIVRDYGSPDQFSIGFTLARTFRLK
jgi:outer membrane scaffolding protein for murein synthesis (MipA/OmpV family)